MKSKNGILRFFYNIVMFCYKKLHIWKVPVPGKEKVKADLGQIYAGENPQECVTDYYVTKLTFSVVILLAGIVLAILLNSTGKEKSIIENQWIYRGTDTEGIQQYDITGRVEDGPTYFFRMEVDPRKYKEAELEMLYRQFVEELPELILGKNESLEAVYSDLELLDSYQGFPFLTEWKSEFPEIIATDGKLYAPETDTAVRLEVEVYYEDFYRKEALTVTAARRIESAEEREKNRIWQLLQQAQEKDPESEKIQLPMEVDGKKIFWKENDPKTGWKILAGAVVAAVAVFFFKDKDLHDLVEKKKKEERRIYPEILQKLTLYLEAGLTIRTAFCRIAEDYEKERKKGERRQEAYEEMLIAAREIHMGIPEGVAYENFGKRTGVREYIRLSTFLLQNLKKGSSQLLQQLREEAQLAEEMRMQNARKLSEEASTKLLLPMVMLLVIVMVIIMVPAFSNAGI